MYQITNIVGPLYKFTFNGWCWFVWFKNLNLYKNVYASNNIPQNQNTSHDVSSPYSIITNYFKLNLMDRKIFKISIDVHNKYLKKLTKFV